MSTPAPSEDPVLDELVTRCLDRREAGEADALDSLCREHPEYASALRRRISLLEQVGLVGSRHRAPASPGDGAQARDFPNRLGEFRLERRVGGGGMGVVYLARQESLGRDVALKLIRPESAYFGGAKARFRREVEAVARLNHPGIVPIYTVGEENGIPYFAMEFVEGVSLSELIARLRRVGSADRLSGREFVAALLGVEPDRPSVVELAARLGTTWVQICVRLVLEVAEALAHAHERGVVHRDVKPSNILITREGRARLADFGLASFGADHSLTQSSSPMGSPPYMAPEVCAGGGAAADERTDIYALGVTLYELLTLRMAFSGDSREILPRILSGDCERVRELNASVPRDVEAVCQKAMDVDQDRRYPKAEAFATDLRNVLELRPVMATRPGWILRTRRFVQRRPAIAMASLLVFFLTVVFPLGYSQVLAVKNREIEAQQDVARRHRDATLASLQAIVDAVARPDLPDVPAVTEYRLSVLAEAERVIDFLGEEERTRGDAMAQRVRIEAGAAMLALRLGRPLEAEEKASRVIGWIERRGWTESPNARAELARMMTLRANARIGLARTEEAKEDALSALAIWRRSLQAGTLTRETMANYLDTLSIARPIASIAGDPEFATAVEEESELVEARAVEAYPQDAAFAFSRLERIVANGVAAAYAGRLEEVPPALEQARTLFDRISKSTDYDRDSAPKVLGGLAELHAYVGEFDAALERIMIASSIALELMTDHPDRPTYRYQRARMLAIGASYQLRIGRGNASERDSRYQAAKSALEESIGEFRGLGAFLDQDVAAASDFAAALGLLADIYLDSNEPARAEELIDESLRRMEEQLRVNPDNWSNRANYAKTLEIKAIAQRDAHRFDDAITTLSRAREGLADCRSRGLAMPRLVDGFIADNLLAAARVFDRAGRIDDAIAVVSDLRAVAHRARDRRDGLAVLGGLVERAANDPALRDRAIDLALDLLDGAKSDEGELSRIREDGRIAPLRAMARYAKAENGGS